MTSHGPCRLNEEAQKSSRFCAGEKVCLQAEILRPKRNEFKRHERIENEKKAEGSIERERLRPVEVEDAARPEEISHETGPASKVG